jgi:uncharacterized OB-fold protein
MNKPIPRPNADSQHYWDGCALGELRYQYCSQCDHAQFYPRAICLQCGNAELEWRVSSGRGQIYAFTEVHIGLPEFKEEAPYPIVLVELEEGFRVLMNIVGKRTDVVLAIGRTGQVVFEERGDLKLPQFELS